MTKVRRVDFYPDEYIVGVSRMSLEHQGLYWMVCSLVMSHGGPVPNDPKWIGKLANVGAARCRRLLADLVSEGKLIEKDSKLSQKRAEKELELAQKRIESAAENGKKGGRPSSENNELAKPGGLSGEKLTTNYQLPTTNQQDKEDDSPPATAALLPFKADRPPNGESSSGKRYRWQGEVIRLTDADFDRWAECFSAIDLPCQLAALDAYLASPSAKDHERKRWFPFVAGALKNRHEDARAKERLAAKNPATARQQSGYGAY